jgi:hypothetical protein
MKRNYNNVTATSDVRDVEKCVNSKYNPNIYIYIYIYIYIEREREREREVEENREITSDYLLCGSGSKPLIS